MGKTKRKQSTFERLRRGELNRKQRRNLARRLAGNDPGLTIIHANAGGIDVGNESHFVAVPPDRDANPVQEFGCWTADLKRMAEWLKACGIDTVAMQATGVYSIPLYDILTGHGMQVVLVNAQHSKNVPGRNVLSDITGVSGQAIIAAILQGERDPWKLADLKHEMVKASREEVARSLEGNWRDDLLFELQQAVNSYHFVHQQMRACDRQIESFLASLPTKILERPPQPDGAPAATAKKAKKPRKPRKARHNQPTVDLTTALKRICGVDLTSIDGIDVITAQTIISEIGTDISKFKTEGHFASWLGLTPAKDITGGKIIGRGRRKVQNRVAMALRMAATTLLESKSYLGARYRHLRQRLPSHAAAVKAMARYLAVLVYRVLTHGEAWVDRGAAKFEQRRTEWELRSLTSKALAKGFKLVPITAAS